MATLDNASVIREFYRAFDDKDFERVRALMHPEAVIRNMAFDTSEGPVESLRSWGTAFPDGKVEVTSLVAQGDRVVAEFIGRGPFTGPLEGPGGARIAPTNRRAELRFIEVFELRDGRIAAGRLYFDALSFMTRLGIGAQPMAAQRPIVPAPEARH